MARAKADKVIKKKLPRGALFQMVPGCSFYFRYQLNGVRTTENLKTKDLKTAEALVEERLRTIDAPSLEVFEAHISHLKFNIKKNSLLLSDAWITYNLHPDKASPATVSEQNAYATTWSDFRDFIEGNPKLSDISAADAIRYADHMRKQHTAVDTHNRKIRRLMKIFGTLKEYQPDNPFSSAALRRKEREEQGNTVSRKSFTREEEAKILAVLKDDRYKVLNKPEIRVLYHIGMFTGQRLKDCALLQWENVNMERNLIWVKQFKTGVKVTIPIAPPLLEALKEAKTWRKNAYVLPAVAQRYNTQDSAGKNRGAMLINFDIMRVVKWIGLDSNVKVPGRNRAITVYGFHSLRHSWASFAAESGVPKAVAQSILGAASEILDRYYIHIGEDAQIAAINTVSQHRNLEASPQKRIDRALALIEGAAIKDGLIRELELILRGVSSK
ncbi:MAG: hypothetical protein RL095_843 [Verrucomicrobiota bacterium]|jgi:integrase